jgi:hypothetical protein
VSLAGDANSDIFPAQLGVKQITSPRQLSRLTDVRSVRTVEY